MEEGDLINLRKVKINSKVGAIGATINLHLFVIFSLLQQLTTTLPGIPTTKIFLDDPTKIFKTCEPPPLKNGANTSTYWNLEEA